MNRKLGTLQSETNIRWRQPSCCQKRANGLWPAIDCSLFSLSIEKGSLAVAKRTFSPIHLFRDQIWSQKNRSGKERALQGASGPKGVIGQRSFGMSATPRQPHCSAAWFTSEQLSIRRAVRSGPPRRSHPQLPGQRKRGPPVTVCSLFSLSIEKAPLADDSRPICPTTQFRDDRWSQENRFSGELTLRRAGGPKAVSGQPALGAPARPGNRIVPQPG